jgi:cell wall-associated NlpC family hydrolase
LVGACTIALTSALLVVPRASADQISDLKGQASALAARIQDLGRQEAALGEQYDADQLAVQTLEGKVAIAAQQVATSNSHASRARTALQSDAINAYVHGGSDPMTSSGTSVNNATNGLLRAEYVNSLATNQNDAIDQYHLAALQQQAAKTNLQQQTSAAQDEVQQVNRDRQAATQAQANLQASLNQDTGQIAVLVAQQQAAAEAAAAAAAQARLAAQKAAQQAATQQAAQQAAQQATQAAAQPAQIQAPTPRQVSAPAPGVPATTAPSVSAPQVGAPPVGQGASGAVAAAESRVGDPYVWGAAGPSAFDCSGLVMWAYAQVGISLPHFSGAQYADTTHIPMSALEPGDLVFPSDPGQHVAMYVGNGDIVEAPFTGATVHVVPMGSWFVYASRVA